MEQIAKYQNGNTTVTILSDGTKIREYEDVPSINFPESIDVKISDYCNLDCKYCHESSTTKGVHGDLNKLLDVISELPSGVELACLDGKTLVFTENGAKHISDLKIGDTILNEQGSPVLIKNIFKKNKETIKVKFTKGLNLIATPDHIFLNDDNVEIMAKDLVGQKLKIASHNVFKKIQKIDLSEYILKNSRQSGVKGGNIGGKTTEQKVKMHQSAPWINRYIYIDEDLMWLYGITVAEGSSKGISLNSNEERLAIESKNLYKKIFNLDTKIYKNNKKNSIAVEFCQSKTYSTVFFDILKINKGARNKSIEFLFGLEKELIRTALFSMIIGDGCFRKRENKKNDNLYYSISYKTSSYKLANELVYILKTVFDVDSSYYEGWNKKRKIDGRDLPITNYFKIDIYGINNLIKLFPNLYEEAIKLEGKYNIYTTTDLKAISIENSGIREVYDIVLEDNCSHLFSINNGIISHNCGGGNPLSHPKLIPFLQKLKQRGIIANITVNQGHLKTYQDMLIYLIKDDLVKGVGISITSENFKYVKPLLDITDNVVYHLIAGVNRIEVIDKLMEFGNCKVLILGYKVFGFGTKYFENEQENVKTGLKEWYKKLPKYVGECTLSFDNLAIEQLKVKRLFTHDGWDKFYMGDDFTFTMYIDAVKQEFAPTSRSKNRTSFKDSSLIEYFNKNRVK